jgi:hypothetical protein
MHGNAALGSPSIARCCRNLCMLIHLHPIVSCNPLGTGLARVFSFRRCRRVRPPSPIQILLSIGGARSYDVMLVYDDPESD